MSLDCSSTSTTVTVLQATARAFQDPLTDSQVSLQWRIHPRDYNLKKPCHPLWCRHRGSENHQNHDNHHVHHRQQQQRRHYEILSPAVRQPCGVKSDADQPETTAQAGAYDKQETVKRKIRYLMMMMGARKRSELTSARRTTMMVACRHQQSSIEHAPDNIDVGEQQQQQQLQRREQQQHNFSVFADSCHQSSDDWQLEDRHCCCCCGDYVEFRRPPGYKRRDCFEDKVSKQTDIIRELRDLCQKLPTAASNSRSSSLLSEIAGHLPAFSCESAPNSRLTCKENMHSASNNYCQPWDRCSIGQHNIHQQSQHQFQNTDDHTQAANHFPEQQSAAELIRSGSKVSMRNPSAIVDVPSSSKQHCQRHHRHRHHHHHHLNLGSPHQHHHHQHNNEHQRRCRCNVGVIPPSTSPVNEQQSQSSTTDVEASQYDDPWDRTSQCLSSLCQADQSLIMMGSSANHPYDSAWSDMNNEITARTSLDHSSNDADHSSGSSRRRRRRSCASSGCEGQNLPILTPSSPCSSCCQSQATGCGQQGVTRRMSSAGNTVPVLTEMYKPKCLNCYLHNDRPQQHGSVATPCWWHGDLTRKQAEKLLIANPGTSVAEGCHVGDFLVRTSESSAQSGDMTLSMLTETGVVHMKITKETELGETNMMIGSSSSSSSSCQSKGFISNGKKSLHKYVLGQCSQPFNSIESMLSHYSTHPLPIRGASLHVKLRRAICRPGCCSSTHSSWNHPPSHVQ